MYTNMVQAKLLTSFLATAEQNASVRGSGDLSRRKGMQAAVCLLIMIFTLSYGFKHGVLKPQCVILRHRIAVGGANCTRGIDPVAKKAAAMIVSLLIYVPTLCGMGACMSAADSGLFIPAANEHSSLVNVLPTEDFWYPPYVIGDWDTELSFKGAKFTDKVPLDVLSTGDNVPGFCKYSVFFVPNVGRDAAGITRRYVQLDSHPREDHSQNILQLVTAFAPGTVVDSAAYGYQAASALFNSPGNKWKIKYHDSDGEGTVELRTTRRNIEVYAGTLETTEHFTQKHTRREYASRSGVENEKITLGDYAINWKLSVPASSADDFVTVSDLSKSNSLVGELNILVYPQPTSDLYLKIPKEPAGTFTYEVKMQRKGSVQDALKNTVYPFVSRRAGAVELNDYFGY